MRSVTFFNRATILGPKPQAAILAIAFVAGELWGHAGHGAELSHVLGSALVSLAVVYGLLRWAQDRFTKASSTVITRGGRIEVVVKPEGQP